MKSITALSKYLGCYDSWQQIRKQYNLKWTTGQESISAMERFFNPGLSLESMIAKVKQMISVLGGHMGQIVEFCVLTGLRPSEAVESVRLLNLPLVPSHYYNPKRQCLEHFRYPDIFLRTTKKAYISFVTSDMIEYCKMSHRTQIPTYNSIRLACRKKHGISMDMRYCRKIFASWLHKEGISDITVDMLQGRTPKSVLAQHYLTPDSSLRDRVLEAVDKLKSELDAQ